MKLLIDQNLPVPVATLLRAKGYDAVHTEELGKERAEDIDLIALASAEGRIVVTRDAHFHRHIATLGLLAPSTIQIRTDQLDWASITSIVDGLCLKYGDELNSGCLLTYKAKSIRLRSLPVHGRLPIRKV